MSEIRTDILERFGRDACRPATFRERGVSVPFTTPLLLGARIRPAGAAATPEVVIPNPSGARGFYVVPWAALPEVCCPTLHDRRLWQRLSGEPAITPLLVREVARAVAAEGLAGREAAAAAARAREEDAAARTRARSVLLLDLIRRTETMQEAATPPEADTPAGTAQRAERALARFAPRLGVSAEVVSGWLESLAGVVCGAGLPGDATASRNRALIRRLESLAQEVGAWGAQSPDPKAQHAAALVAEAARLTLACATAVLRDLDAMLADTPALLRCWREDPAALSGRAARLDWVLDGWEIVCALWRDADPALRAGALWEMALLAPVMPREAEEWAGTGEDWERPIRMRRALRANEEWRGRRVPEVVARNERLRARAA